MPRILLVLLITASAFGAFLLLRSSDHSVTGPLSVEAVSQEQKSQEMETDAIVLRPVEEANPRWEVAVGKHMASVEQEPVVQSSASEGWRTPSEAISAKYEHLGPEDFERAVQFVAEAYKLEQHRILEERLQGGLFQHFVGVPTGQTENLPSTSEDMPMGSFGKWVIPREDGLTETKTVIIPFAEYPEFEQLAQEHYWLSYWQRKRKPPFQLFKQ